MTNPPTLAGFQDFVSNYMNIPASALPVGAPAVAFAFQIATDLVNPVLNCVSPDLFTLATYNLAGSNLIEYAPDQTGQTFFADARKFYGVSSFAPGLVQSTSDNSTATSLSMPKFTENLSLSDLQLLKNPWGRRYLEIAAKAGPLWGMS